MDIKKLNAVAGLPVIAVTHKKPNLDKVHLALRNLPETEARWEAILNAGEILSVSTRNKAEKVYMEVAGVSERTAMDIVKLTSTRSNIPEALRVAHCFWFNF